MEISPESVQDFKRIFQEQYGVKMNDEDSRESAQNLVDLFELLIKVDRRLKTEN